MTTEWDERTEAIPGTKGDKSFELDLEFGQEPQPQPDATLQVERPSIVVFEPAPLGLAHALEAMGYAVRVGTTGVDVMSIVAVHMPAVVVCAPAPDAERRRLLAAALRLRFPAIPVVYVSVHAAHEEAVLGAIREGARTVLPWPLPPAADVSRALLPFVSQTEQMARSPSGRLEIDDDDVLVSDDRPTRPVPMAPRGGKGAPDTDSDELHDVSTAPQHRKALGPSPPEQFENARTAVMPQQKSKPSVQPAGAGQAKQPLVAPRFPPLPPLSPPPPPLLVLPEPIPLARPASPGSPGDTPRPPGPDEPSTQPGLRPTSPAMVEAQAEKRGEIGELLAAVSPFLWSLEDAARWADRLGATDATAKNHAKTLHLLAKILAQLQARIDDLGA